MYIRFVSLTIDAESRQRQGILRTANSLVEKDEINEEEEDCINEIFTWFNDNLFVPSLPYNQVKAVFWFRGSATEHIKRMWDLTNILRSHDCVVEVRICKLLYNICYRDEYQVASLPSQNNSKVMIK